MERLGLSYEALSAVRPALIYCSISGYGQEGPRRDAPAYDGAVQASSGMMSIGGEPGQDPLRVAFPVIDMTTGLNACIAITSALYRRATTGAGQFLDVAMFDSALSVMSPVVNSYLVAGTEPYQTGNSSLTLQPTTDLFPTKNGSMQIAALTMAQIESLCATLGRSDLLADERFRTIADQITNREAMRAEIAPLFLERTRVEWVEILTRAGVPVGRVVTIPEALAEPQVKARRLLVETPLDLPGVELPEVDEPRTIVNAGWEAGDEGPDNGAPAPRLGQHSDEVLGELGLAASEIAGLRQGGVIV
jgi:crotonobetainyl-CoA:carnitine CoA-transferase CaiB-like acyl-CoA transferase